MSYSGLLQHSPSSIGGAKLQRCRLKSRQSTRKSSAIRASSGLRPRSSFPYECWGTSKDVALSRSATRKSPAMLRTVLGKTPICTRWCCGVPGSICNRRNAPNQRLASVKLPYSVVDLKIMNQMLRYLSFVQKVRPILLVLLERLIFKHAAERNLCSQYSCFSIPLFHAFSVITSTAVVSLLQRIK
jgi:hypothetical protein